MMETLLVENPTIDLRAEQLLQPEPQHERFWCRRWSPRDPVRIRGVEHLTVLLASLGRTGDYAGITDEATGVWAQVKRLGDRWWVEGRSASEDWPRVFVPESWLDQAGSRPFDEYATWSHSMAAELVWAFLDGSTTAGAVRLPAPGGDDA